MSRYHPDARLRAIAWIDAVSPERASGRLASVYRKESNRSGSVPNIVCALSSMPDELYHLLKLRDGIADIHRCPDLTAFQVEAINVLVSAVNRCRHCRTSHGARLARMGEQEVVTALADGRIPAQLDGRSKALLSYCLRLATDASEVQEVDIAHLREVGFRDDTIVRIALLVAYRCFMNVIADGLGVADEPATSGLGTPVRRPE